MLRQTKVLPPTREGSNLTLAGGAAHRVVDDAANGLAGNVLTAPPAGGQLGNVALFIDQNSQQLGSVAEVKFWGWGCASPCCGVGKTSRAGIEIAVLPSHGLQARYGVRAGGAPCFPRALLALVHASQAPAEPNALLVQARLPRCTAVPSSICCLLIMQDFRVPKPLLNP